MLRKAVSPCPERSLSVLVVGPGAGIRRGYYALRFCSPGRPRRPLEDTHALRLTPSPAHRASVDRRLPGARRARRAAPASRSPRPNPRRRSPRPARPAAPAPANPRGPLAAPQKIVTVEGITEYRLANGLTVLLFPDETKQTITVNVTYMVGSRNENYGETGMAHLLEHLVFKGTPKHQNIPQELTSHGARPNGSTWFDRTNYFETFQAERREPRLGARPRGRPDGEFLHRQEGPRQRDDGRAQRVRDGRERPVLDPRGARAARRRSSGTTTGSPRSARSRTSRTSRSTSCRRSTGRGTSPTTRCCSSPAGSTRRRRCRRSTRPSAASPGRPGSCRCSTRSTRRRTASARCGSSASATCRRSPPLTTCRRARARNPERSTS